MKVDTDKLRDAVADYCRQAELNHGKPNRVFPGTVEHIHSILDDVERWAQYLTEQGFIGGDAMK